MSDRDDILTAWLRVAAWTCPRCRHRIELAPGGNLLEKGRQHLHDHVTEDYAMTTTPETVGDFYAIGQEIISTTATPQPDTVLNWAGETYDRARLRALGALAHRLDPEFPAPDDDDDDDEL